MWRGAIHDARMATSPIPGACTGAHIFHTSRISFLTCTRLVSAQAKIHPCCHMIAYLHGALCRQSSLHIGSTLSLTSSVSRMCSLCGAGQHTLCCHGRRHARVQDASHQQQLRPKCLCGAMSSSEEIFCDEARPPCRPKARHDVSDQRFLGPWCVFAIVACAGGAWASLGDEAALPDKWSAAGTAQGVLVGFVCAREWALTPAGSSASGKLHERMRSASVRVTKAAQQYGFVEHAVQAAVALHEFVVARSETAAGAAQHVGHALATAPGMGSRAAPVSEHVAGWRAAGAVMGRVLRLAPRAAFDILSGTLRCLHCVAITKRTHRQAFLCPTKPSRRVLGAFVQAASASSSTAALYQLARTQRKSNRGWKRDAHEVSIVLDWLQATKYIRSVKKMREAAASFAPLFARASGSSADRLVAGLPRVHPEVLRKARVRLDCMAMVLFRSFWQAQVQQLGIGMLPNIYIFADASPQWRGLELYASSFDMLIGATIAHRLFPMLSLDKDLLDAAGKCLALVWQIFLLAGPSYFFVRLFCSRVRSITTDQGTERKLADFAQVLPGFYQMIDAAYRVRDESPMEHLFPRALAMPGWMHLWDLMLRRGLSSLPFFPTWVVGLKAIVSFLRSSVNTAVVVRSLKAKGLTGAAELVERATLPSFAEWRWGTLLSVCKALAGFLETLAANFDGALFANTRDRVGVNAMLTALKSVAWRRRFRFIRWFCEWLGGLMAWGRGCKCHEEQLKAGETVNCQWKGRRMKDAFAHASRELRSGLEEANSWEFSTWSLDSEEAMACQACVRATYHLASQKIRFLDRVPYLLCRLDEPGVKERCLEQWSEAPPEAHHRVTREFLSPTQALRRHVDLVQPDGSGISEELRNELLSLAAIPLDDSVAEGPHASANRHMSHSRAAKWPWVASTMRLAQNLEDARDLPAAAGIDTSAAWTMYKTVVRGPSYRGPRRGRVAYGAHVSLADFQKRVYNMTSIVEQAPETTQGGQWGDDNANDDIILGGCSEHPAGAEATSRRHKRRRLEDVAEQADTEADMDRQEKGPGRAVVGACGVADSSGRGQLLRRKNTEEVKLLRQFFAACLEKGRFVSVRAQSEEDSGGIMIFQVLSFEAKAVLVKTYDAADDSSYQALSSVAVQVYSKWGAVGQDTEAHSSHDVFFVEEPCTIDLVSLSGGLNCRQHWLQWEAGPSDVSGCICLTSPSPWRSSVPLTSSNVPVLCLIDALQESGWSGRGEKVIHHQETYKAFDSRNIASKRAYLQCLLALPELLPKVGAFPSGETSAFYELLMSGRKAIEAGKPAKVYRAQLAALQGDALDSAALAAEAACLPSPQLALEDRSKRVLKTIDSDSSIYGDAGVAPAGDTVVSPPALVGEAAVIDHHDAPEEVFGDEGARPAPAAELRCLSADVPWPSTLLGQRLRTVKGRAGGAWSYEPRLTVSCRNPGHVGCAKSRSIAMDSVTFGRLAPVYFLGAWLQRADMPVAEHKKYLPDRAAMRAFADQYQP